MQLKNVQTISGSPPIFSLFNYTILVKLELVRLSLYVLCWTKKTYVLQVSILARTCVQGGLIFMYIYNMY